MRAFELLPCGLGLDCSKDFLLQADCAISGVCYETRFDKVKTEIGDARRYAEVISLYARLVAAVKRRDSGAFAKPMPSQ